MAREQSSCLLGWIAHLHFTFCLALSTHRPIRPQVQLMTDYDADVSSPGVVPTSGDYVGCYNDLVGDRILSTVLTDDALTPAVSISSKHMCCIYSRQVVILRVPRSTKKVFRSVPPSRKQVVHSPSSVASSLTSCVRTMLRNLYGLHLKFSMQCTMRTPSNL